MIRFANILITHQTPDCVARMLAHWSSCVQPEGLWVAYGGQREHFERINHPQKFFLESPRIRVRDLQRERQGYAEIFQQAVAHGAVTGVDYIHLAEYDQYPVAGGVNDRQLAALLAENADLLCYRLERLDGTNHPHYLSHVSAPEFMEFLRSFSVRPDPAVVLSALGFGGLWTREAFERVAAVAEPFPIYLELFLPTVAHHVGCRVRGNGQDMRFTPYAGDASPLLAAAKQAGAWFIHPWKSVWNT